MDTNLFFTIGFRPKENTIDIYTKSYQDNYFIDIDIKNHTINYGGKIKVYDKFTQNIVKPEDFVVLECVNRLLERGYKPENIQLEKVYPAGHGFSGRLDICVTHDDGTEYLLIECKTYGKEFDKEFNRMKKDGGQLFTYFKFSNNADIIMLYASELKADTLVYKNEIVKIEDDYKTGDVKDFYDKWNKLTKDNGVFDPWVNPYNFESKALTINELEEIRPEDSSFIFNRFLEILRHNVVSDKPNAFNKIFTLFLCKIYDEKSKHNTDEELDFQWIEGKDDNVSFQLRLTDLYKNGMKDFLDKNVTDFSDEDFDSKYASLFSGDEQLKKSLKTEIARLRLEKNNEFAIKEVYDQKSFLENAKVVKEVVELLQGFKIRYTQKQQYLSDFFELLLTTGLKQESGQFFTPVPIAQFIIKSLPIDKMVEDKLKSGKKDDLLPFIIDYAAGSGHFLTESMHEIQRLLLNTDTSKLKSEAKSFIDVSKIRHFDWASQYVYGIEKDYRLVKVGKVGCYLHGDGLANVMHSDGLSNFKHSDYKGKLNEIDKDFCQENKQFEILVSNPPYSVSAFKNASREYYRENDFELYDKLTDNSSEIECLFVERTKQLLKDGGVTGIILPSSILSNTGIYTKTREIILQYFEIIAIAELGSNTFMATGTNTVTLFMRRRNNYDSINLKIAIEKFFSVYQDVTLGGVEKPVTKYINYVWGAISFDDYISMLKCEPNEKITKHEIYTEYRKKLKAKNEKEFWNLLLEREAEKLYYFILTYPQKVILIKSGEKDAEKRFLGYEFSNRRGSEGIHPIQRGKSIDECTQLFDSNIFDNPTKASTYIYKAFEGDFDSPIHESIQNNVTRHNLVDMLTFDRVEFEKNISLSVKKKVKIESKWQLKRLGEISTIDYGTRIVKKTAQGSVYPVYGGGGETFKSNDYNREDVFIISRFGMSPKCVRYVYGKFFLNDSGLTLNTSDSSVLNQNYLNQYLFLNQERVYLCGQGVAQKNLEIETFNSLKIPLPPLDIQQKIVNEIAVLEAKEKKAKEEIESLKSKSNEIFSSNNETVIKRFDEVCKLKAGDFVKVGNISKEKIENSFPCYGGNGLRGYVKTFTHEGKYSLVGRQGALCGNVHLVEGKFHATEHALVAKPLNDIDINWLHHKLVSMNLNQYATGTAQPGLSVINLKPIEINVPPLSEQQKIVSKIEKIEAQIALLETQIAEIPKQKEGILKKYL
ncbi:MAG: restriction endonuclease subunit S [Sulfuricurvum sp. MLSB]|uniref:restriction endonuclease subunit S n=1 Tax=unclassified Sulfuricurvum TaxID=2632390 RepID=UPI000506D3C8|nr:MULTISPECIES: restriction endonuclease subunit S [unclassified Sulfuricurvum]KFN40578.1 MAG: restriction endonuclease subunit S [Sulfuricurvum sp. MLSB]